MKAPRVLEAAARVAMFRDLCEDLSSYVIERVAFREFD